MLLVVFDIEELLDGVGGFALVDAEADPHLESVHLLARETLIHDTYSQNFLVEGEAVSDEVLDELLPNNIQEIKSGLLAGSEALPTCQSQLVVSA